MTPKITVTIQSESGIKNTLTLHDIGDDTWACIIRDMRKLLAKLDEMNAKMNEILGK